MNAQRISRIVGGVALAAVALVVIMVVSRMRESDPMPTVQATEGRVVMGDLTGVVGRVDQKARTVEVAETKGQPPITMTVTDDTAITVRGEQRGIRDLKKDLPVRAFYEVRNDVTYLTRIQVVTNEKQAKKTSPAEAMASPAPATGSSTSAVAAAPAPASAPAAAVAPAPTAPPLVPPIAPAPPLTPVAEAPAPPRQTVSAGPSVAADAGDGSEAVDWLLKRRR